MYSSVKCAHRLRTLGQRSFIANQPLALCLRRRRTEPTSPNHGAAGGRGGCSRTTGLLSSHTERDWATIALVDGSVTDVEHRFRPGDLRERPATQAASPTPKLGADRTCPRASRHDEPLRRRRCKIWPREKGIAWRKRVNTFDCAILRRVRVKLTTYASPTA